MNFICVQKGKKLRSRTILLTLKKQAYEKSSVFNRAFGYANFIKPYMYICSVD